MGAPPIIDGQQTSIQMADDAAAAIAKMEPQAQEALDAAARAGAADAAPAEKQAKRGLFSGFGKKKASATKLDELQGAPDAPQPGAPTNDPSIAASERAPDAAADKKGGMFKGFGKKKSSGNLARAASGGDDVAQRDQDGCVVFGSSVLGASERRSARVWRVAQLNAQRTQLAARREVVPAP